MYAKDIVVGGKVIPVIWTLGGGLKQSKEVAKAKELGQKFLYVVKVTDKGVVVSATKGAKSGETFATIDLRAPSWGGWDCRVNPGKTLKAGKSKAKKAAPKAKAKTKAAASKANGHKGGKASAAKRATKKSDEVLPLGADKTVDEAFPKE